MNPVVEVNPFKCRVWELHDRLEGYLTEESCKAEIESVAKHGQLVPALGRPLRGDPEYDVEIIYGSRRLFVARLLNRNLRVDLRELSDREAIIAMDIENRHRADLSPYERGLSYQRWLRSKQFGSQDEIAQTLKISPAQVSRLVKLARLPTVVVAAFESPMDIRESWGLELVDAWEDRDKQRIIAERARQICARNERPNPPDIFTRLLAPAARGERGARGSRKHGRGRDEVVSDEDGEPLFRIRPQRGTFALLLPRAIVTPRCLDDIKRALTELLQRERSERDDLSKHIGRPGGVADLRPRTLDRQDAFGTQ
jgi:ParB family chromosome partitioning protein